MVRVVIALALVAACGRSHEAPASSSGSGSAEAPRIVTLSPSATEIVAALDATPLLVGVDDYSKEPPEVRALPKVGSFMAPNLEAIVRLRPTLVIVDDVHTQQAAALRDAHVTTVECAMHALPDVKSALHTLGERLGRTAKADAVIAGIDRALDDASAKKPAHHPRVLAIIDRESSGLGNLVAAGPGSWVDELLAVVGGDNVLAAAPARYPKISVEEVLRARPEVILDLSEAARTSVAPWQELDVPAVKAHRVVALQDQVLVAPTPRVRQALELLATSLR